MLSGGGGQRAHEAQHQLGEDLGLPAPQHTAPMHAPSQTGNAVRTHVVLSEKQEGASTAYDSVAQVEAHRAEQDHVRLATARHNAVEPGAQVRACTTITPHDTRSDGSTDRPTDLKQPAHAAATVPSSSLNRDMARPMSVPTS